MQKKFKIEVDCANCAAKIETAVKALPGVIDSGLFQGYGFEFVRS